MTAIDIYAEAYEEITQGSNDPGALLDSLARLADETVLDRPQFGVWAAILVHAHFQILNK